MPSNYALALQCQLKRDEMYELLAFSAEAALVTSTDNTVKGGAASDECDKRFLWSLLLTDAHVRQLMMHTLVRVSIPKSKQQVLINDNKYAKATGSVETRQHNYRVGRVVALVPRSRASSGAQRATGYSASSSSLLLSDWLLGVSLGEITELLGAKYVSNESFTAEEHAVYVHSCLSTRANTTSTPKPAVGASTLMTAPEADMVIRNMHDIRQFVAAVMAKRDGKARTGAVALAAASGETAPALKMHAGSSAAGGGGRKRQREVGSAVGDGCGDEGSDDEEDGATRGKLLAEHRRLEALCAEQRQHLADLRQLLNSKNGEVRRALQAQRMAETEHLAEMGRWRAKAEEQGQAMRRTERLLTEEREAHKEHQEKTGKLVTQLKMLAEQTRKFKEISDTLAGWLRTSTKQPEEVLACLKKKIMDAQA